MNNIIRFQPYRGFQWDNGFDVRKDAHDQAIIIETLRRYLDIDFTQASISAWVDNGINQKMSVGIYFGKELVQHMDFDSIVTGTVVVRLKNRSAMRRDLVGDLTRSWLEKLGFPQGYPCGTEIEVSNGRLVVEITPCF